MTLLIITGTGRCGTSVLARFCHNIGYGVGGQWCSDRNAGMEEPTVVEINNGIMRGENLERADRFVSEFSRIIVKDPRFVRRGVLDFWASRRRDLELVVCVRDLSCTYRSIEMMQASVGMPKHVDPYTSEADVAMTMHSFWCDVAKFKLPVKVLAFPDFLDDYARVVAALGPNRIDACGRERSKRVWNALVDPAKVHHR